ncbi:hypothetical protein ACFZBU_21030 [Embleya sp. NPDC008237]|uniref:hypothetical protein n=1 Tax=Embleya sp. NPDC008237 TaxID=3363978 RepID=UPI0036E4B733
MSTPATATTPTASGVDPIDVLLPEGRERRRAGALTATAVIALAAGPITLRLYTGRD